MNRDRVKQAAMEALANGGSLEDEEGAAEAVIERFQAEGYLPAAFDGEPGRLLTTLPKTADPKFPAALALLQRCGATVLQARYSDDQEPVVWFFVAGFGDGRWDAAAGPEPLLALLRLCTQLVDGGQCTHCSKPTIFLDEIGDTPTVYDPLMCQVQWDPELRTFRRSCEGDDR